MFVPILVTVGCLAIVLGVRLGRSQLAHRWLVIVPAWLTVLGSITLAALLFNSEDGVPQLVEWIPVAMTATAAPTALAPIRAATPGSALPGTPDRFG